MEYRIMQCEMRDGGVIARKIVGGPTESLEAAEGLAIRLAHSHSEAGFDGNGRYWWARDPLGREFRFAIERTGLDETDGV
jgi:hypothetical protein